MRRLAIVPFTSLAILFLSGGPALADPEWCDSGSPPPNDFRLRPTGAASATSTTSWLNSVTSGSLDLALGVNTLQGGVANGMTHALANARPYDTLPPNGTRDR